MLGPAQPDALGAKSARNAAIGRGFGIGADFHPPVPVSPAHQHTKISDQFGLDRWHVPGHDLSGGAIKRDLITLFQLTRADPQRPIGDINRHCRSPRNARPPHPARHHGGV